MPLGAARQSLDLAGVVPLVDTSYDVTFVASSFQSSTANSSIVIPAAAQAGDIAVLFDRQNTTTSGFVTPTGWTTIANRFNGGNKSNISYKVLTAGDPGLSITGQGTTARKIMVVYRPSEPINSVTVVTNSQTGPSFATTAAPASLTQDLTAQTSRPILSYAFYSSSTNSVWSRGSTLTAEREITDGGGFTWVRMFVFNAGSSTSTVNTITGGTSAQTSVKFMFQGSLRLS
jgi:hypothetical protein